MFGKGAIITESQSPMSLACKGQTHGMEGRAPSQSQKSPLVSESRNSVLRHVYTDIPAPSCKCVCSLLRKWKGFSVTVWGF